MLIAFSEVGRQAIYADPNWQDGDYYDNGAQARRRAGRGAHGRSHHLPQRSSRCTRSSAGGCKTQERYGYEFQTEFQIESYLKYKGNNFTQRFDANSYLYVTKAMDYFDLSAPDGLAGGRVRRTRPRSSSWSSASPATGSTRRITARNWCSALTAVGADVTYLDIESAWGHDAFLLEVETMTRLLSSFLDRLVR